jgi:hypothetical protein
MIFAGFLETINLNLVIYARPAGAASLNFFKNPIFDGKVQRLFVCRMMNFSKRLLREIQHNHAGYRQELQ